jgi:hypothetical protein
MSATRVMQATAFRASDHSPDALESVDYFLDAVHRPD